MPEREYQPLIFSLLRDRVQSSDAFAPSREQLVQALKRRQFEMLSEAKKTEGGVIPLIRKLMDEKAVEEGRRRMSAFEEMLQRNLNNAPQIERLQELVKSFDPVEDPAMNDITKALRQFEDSEMLKEKSGKALDLHNTNREVTRQSAARIQNMGRPDHGFSGEIMETDGRVRPDPTMSRSEHAWIKHVQDLAQKAALGANMDSEHAKADMVDRFKRSGVTDVEKSDLSDRFEKREVAVGASEKLIADKDPKDVVKQIFHRNFQRELKSLNESRQRVGKPPLVANSLPDVARIIRENLDGDIRTRLKTAQDDARQVELAAKVTEAARKMTAPGQSESQTARSVSALVYKQMRSLPATKAERTEALLSIINHGSNSNPAVLDERMKAHMGSEDRKLLDSRLNWIKSEVVKFEKANGPTEYSREALRWAEKAMLHLRNGELSKMSKAMKAGHTAFNIAKKGPTPDSKNLLDSWSRQYASLEDSAQAIGHQTPFMKQNASDMGTLEESVGEDFNDVEKLQKDAKYQNKKDSFYFQRGKQAIEDDADIADEFRVREKVANRRPILAEDIQKSTEQRLKKQTSRGSLKQLEWLAKKHPNLSDRIKLRNSEERSKISLAKWLAKNKKHSSYDRLRKMMESKKPPIVGKAPVVETAMDVDIPVRVVPIGEKKRPPAKYVLRKETPKAKPVRTFPTREHEMMRGGGTKFPQLSGKGRTVLEYLLKNEKPHAPRVFNPASLLKKVAQILSKAR